LKLKKKISFKDSLPDFATEEQKRRCASFGWSYDKGGYYFKKGLIGWYQEGVWYTDDI